MSLNGAETSLIRVLKGCVWHLNMSSTSIGSDFMEIDPVDFDNFRISDKWTQMVELGPNVAFATNFGSAAPTTAASASTPSVVRLKLLSRKELREKHH